MIHIFYAQFYNLHFKVETKVVKTGILLCNAEWRDQMVSEVLYNNNPLSLCLNTSRNQIFINNLLECYLNPLPSPLSMKKDNIIQQF